MRFGSKKQRRELGDGISPQPLVDVAELDRTMVARGDAQKARAVLENERMLFFADSLERFTGISAGMGNYERS